jgi:UDP-N-acetyl-2-amino-2-deoxyglucuronate dehydrogenase
LAKLRFGIIGTGGIARAHANALRGLADRAELVAACDTVPAAAEKFGQEFGIPTYGGPDAVERLLERKDIDAVSLATPSGLHAEQACAALRAGKHVLTEKPMCITLEQADAMIAAQEETGRTLGCVFQQRFNPAAVIVKRAIEEGRFGRILHANAYLKWYRSQQYYDAGGWRGTWAMDGGGALMNQSVHYIDLMQWLVGGVAAVKAYTGTLNHRIETEDVGVAAIRLKSGGLGVIEGMTNNVANEYDRVEVYGTDGMAIIERGNLHSYYTRAEEIPPTPEHPRPSRNLAARALEAFQAAHPGWRTGHPAVFAHFIDAVLQGQEPPVGPREGRKAVAIILSIYRSARENREVEVP